MHFIYTALLLTGLLLSAPFYLVRSKRYAATIRERFGFIATPRLRRCIWVHAVSVGEVRAVERLLERLRAVYPNRPLALSTTTLTGQELARSQGGVDGVFFFPFDLPWAVERALDHIDPEVVIIAETEIWPNFIRACSRRGVKLMMVNGRIADRSLARYRWIRPWLKTILGRYAVLGMQSATDAERIQAIGAPPDKTVVFGNLKYDAADQRPLLDPAFAAVLRETRPLWVAASTAQGEEEFVLDALAALRRRFPTIQLLIAPRKPERFDEVETLIRSRGYRCIRRSRFDSEPRPADAVILLDTIGELTAVFQFASVVFMGGTLAPFGGHNILEPARFAKPIVFGPHMENFREMSALFLKERAALQVSGPEGLAEAVERILADDRLAGDLGAGAKRAADAETGATDRFIAFLGKTLN